MVIEVYKLTQDKLQVLHSEKVDIQIQQSRQQPSAVDDNNENYNVTGIIIAKHGDLGKIKKLLHRENVTYSIIH